MIAMMFCLIVILLRTFTLEYFISAFLLLKLYLTKILFEAVKFPQRLAVKRNVRLYVCIL